MKQRKKKSEVWGKFQDQHKLSDEQREQCEMYYKMLLVANESINLTTITGLRAVQQDHFADSFIVRDFIDLKSINSMADVGAGAGFTALALKILYPHLSILLIEVTRKKRIFLQDVVSELGLNNVEICDLDWRTFLRTTEGEVDLFVSRATFDEGELARVFRHTCSYRNSQVVYWATDQWKPQKEAMPYIKRVVPYSISQKKRKLVFMGII